MMLQIQINTHFELAADGENDFYASIQVGENGFITEKIKFLDVLKRDLESLSEDDKRDYVESVAASFKSFLSKLEELSKK